MRKFLSQFKDKQHKKEDARLADRSASQPALAGTAVTTASKGSNDFPVSKNTPPTRNTQSSAKLEPYVYKRLFHNDVHDNIRIFVLHPGAKDSVISGTLQYAPLSSRPSYECLSYAWGDSLQKVRILCDDNTLEITPNLHEALRQSRYIDKPRSLWIDQICINQQDVRERNIQVLRMAGIFGNASSVLLYLGAFGPGGVDAYELIIKMCSTMGKDSMDTESFRAKRQTVTAETYVQQYDLPPLDSGKWKSIAELFTARVFRRTWVLQEIVLARNLYIFWDDFKLPWEQVNHSRYLHPNFGLFINLVAILSRTWPRKIQIPPNLVRNATFLSDCLLIRDQTRTVGRLNLPLMLQSTRTWESTDPRDKVFGVLCIVSGGDLLGLPDYSLSLDHLYIQTARRIVEYSQSLRHLHYVEVSFSYPGNRELPSWVPDWRKTGTTPYHGDMFSDLPQYRPALGSKPVVAPMKDFRKLELRGLLLDTVKIAEPSVYSKEELFTGHGKWWNLAISVAKDGMYAPTHEKMEVAIARTRVADCWPGSERYVPPSPSSSVSSQSIPSVHPNESTQPYWAALSSHIKSMSVFKRFGTTEQGYIALLPEQTQTGDKIVAFLGGDEPFVIREINAEDFRLIGSCYVHGFMDGEAFEVVKGGGDGVHTIGPKKGVVRDWVLE